MAVLEKIRVKFGIGASIIIALGLLLFIVDPSDIDTFFQPKNNVGEIDGKTISYDEFMNEVDRLTAVNLGSASPTEQQSIQLRDAAWQEFILKDLFIKNAKKAGINLGTDEKVALTTGSMISPIIAQSPAFQDENGNFSVANVLEIGQASKINAQVRLFWENIQNLVYNQQYMSKYNALFNNASAAAPFKVAKSIEENNVTNDVDFVMVPFGYSRDTTVVVSDDEIKAYYNSHKQLFKQQGSRDIEYVVFEVKPSNSDIKATRDYVNASYDEFASTDNVKSFLSKVTSEVSYDGHWYKEGELKSVNTKIDEFVKSAAVGKTSDVVTSGNTFYAARIMDSKHIPDSVYVKHILLKGANAAKADSLLAVVASKKAKFEDVAQEYSADENSVADGVIGNIGWLTQSRNIPGFEKTIFTAAKGKPYIVKTQYGTHIVEVVRTTKAVTKKQVAILAKTAQPGRETRSESYAKASNFAVAAADGAAAYHKAVDTLGLYSHPYNKLTEGVSRLGSVDNAKEVTRWAFSKKVGKVSSVITIDNKFHIVALVNGIHEEGTATLAEVAESIRQQLYYQKLSEKKSAEVAEKIAGLSTLEEIAEALNTSISSRSGVTFATGSGQGLDNAFIGAICAAEVGKISGPVAGNIGTYVFKVTARDTGAFYTEDDAKNAAAQESAYASQGIIPVMIQQADVKDYRERYF